MLFRSVLGRHPHARVLHANLDALLRRRRATQRERAPLRHRLAGVLREVQERLSQHRGIAVHGQLWRHVRVHLHPVRYRLRFHERQDFIEERRHAYRLQRQVLGTRELQEPLHHLVESADLVLDDLDMLERTADVRTRLGRGEFGVTLDLPPGDEFGELGTLFNTVSQQLSADRSTREDQQAKIGRAHV